MPKRAIPEQSSVSAAHTGHEAELWQMADALRGNMDSAEYKHVVLGLIFLKYISDAFEELHMQLEVDKSQGADPEDPDEYLAKNIFWVPTEARWGSIRAQARQSTIGQTIDNAMIGIEASNTTLKDVLPKNYARPSLDKERLGQLVDLISNIRVGDEESRSRDVLGRVYEYFLSKFASAEGKKGGEFYTPNCVVKLLVEMIEPYSGRVYDPCCGSSGMFVQSIEFIRAHANGNGGKGSRVSDISIFGQESNHTTWRLAKMNLAIRGINGKIEYGDSFLNDGHPDLRADYILANPPFNTKDWGGNRLKQDVRWKFGVPPTRNANYAWLQHIFYHLAPNGIAGVVLANGSMSSTHSGEGEIRKAMVDSDIVDCMIALPGQLFYSTQIPVCLWFLTKSKDGNGKNRIGETLLIDAREMGNMVNRVHRELSQDDISKIAETYHLWKKGDMLKSDDDKSKNRYVDISGFCKSVTIDEIRSGEYALNPGRYVGMAEREEDRIPLREKIFQLREELSTLQTEGVRLSEEVSHSLRRIGV